MIKKLAVILSLCGATLFAGCANTVAGAGEDISRMGSAITQAAEGK